MASSNIDNAAIANAGEIKSMKYESIADIYSANQKIRGQFLAVLADVTEAEATTVAESETWSIGHLVEHVATVNNGMAGICGKLIEKAKAAGAASDGTLAISSDFFDKIGSLATRKAEAPERVRPVGGMPLSVSFGRLETADTAFEALRNDFEHVGLVEPKFPHPFFGDLTAIEWFVLAGLHEHRHTGQLDGLLAKVRQ